MQKGRYANSEITCGLKNHLLGKGIARFSRAMKNQWTEFLHGSKCIPFTLGQSLEGFQGSRGQTGRATIGFQMAPPTTSTNAGIRTCIDNHMANFSAMAVLAVEQLSFGDDATSYAGPQRKHYHTRMRRPTTNPEFAVSRCICIIRINHR